MFEFIAFGNLTAADFTHETRHGINRQWFAISVRITLYTTLTGFSGNRCFKPATVRIVIRILHCSAPLENYRPTLALDSVRDFVTDCGATN